MCYYTNIEKDSKKQLFKLFSHLRKYRLSPLPGIAKVEAGWETI